jgi:predicted nucleotidyltransferase
MTDIGLKNTDVEAISHILTNYPSITRAVVFGSRAKGGGSLYADVDIALYGAVDILESEGVICDLDELALIYKFDVIAYERIKNPALKQHIDRVGIKIYEKNPEDGA